MSVEWVDLETNGRREVIVSSVRLGVHEIDGWAVGVHVDHMELDGLQVPEMAVDTAVTLVGKRHIRLAVRNGRRAIVKPHGWDRVHRVHAHRVRQLCNVISAIAIDIGGVADEVFLHPVALFGQRLQALGQRRGAVLAQGHPDRYFKRGVRVQIVPHIEHEVLVGSGLDHDRNGPNLYRRRRRG